MAPSSGPFPFGGNGASSFFIGGKGFIEKFVVHLFQILVAKGDILLKLPVPFLQKAYILLLLFYHNWPQATTSLLLSCEKVTQKHFHTAAPSGLAV